MLCPYTIKILLFFSVRAQKAKCRQLWLLLLMLLLLLLLLQMFVVVDAMYFFGLLAG